MPMTLNHVQRCSPSLTVRAKQIKTTRRDQLNHQNGTNLKSDILFCWKANEKAKRYNPMGKTLIISNKIPRNQEIYQRLLESYQMDAEASLNRLLVAKDGTI